MGCGVGMYPRAFAYHRANTYPEAISLLSELGDEAKFLAGGQSLIPLMKLRLSTPAHLVDLNFIPDTSYIRSNGALRLGAMTRHSEIAASADAARIPILHDCAAGIADPQVRHMGTIGGSIAEADPTGDWAPVLLATGATVKTLGPEWRAQHRHQRVHPRRLHNRIAAGGTNHRDRGTRTGGAQRGSLHCVEALRSRLRQRQRRRATHVA